jgi:DNA-binding winged helix-turn-helix (wHTH) protein
MREFPPFQLDSANQCLWRRRETAYDERVLLTPKAFAVLQYLVERPGQLVTQEELLAAVWPETYVKPEVLKSRIFGVRNALGDRPKTPRFIETLPRRGYRFIATVHDSTVAGPLMSLPLSFGPLVGREHTLGVLRQCLRRSVQRQRQIVFLTGEPGIGKTTLVDAFRQQAAVDVPSLRLACGQCLEGYGGTDAYYPMLEALGQLCYGAGGDTIVQTLAMYAPTWLVQFPALLTRAHRETMQRELLGATRERMLREIAELLEIITAERPLLLVFEDLQWVDHATVDLISGHGDELLATAGRGGIDTSRGAVRMVHALRHRRTSRILGESLSSINACSRGGLTWSRKCTSSLRWATPHTPRTRPDSTVITI